MSKDIRTSPSESEPSDDDAGASLTTIAAALTQYALKLAAAAGGVPARLAKALPLPSGPGAALKPEYLKLMADAGAYLHDAREVAGLTIDELSEAADLKDKSLLAAAEQGTATLSFDLILRLASLLARHDPLPFVLRLVRGYNPEAWQVLENWGLGRISVAVERERQFINIYRAHDSARELSDEEFADVLAFTRSAFEMALRFRAGDWVSDASETAED